MSGRTSLLALSGVCCLAISCRTEPESRDMLFANEGASWFSGDVDNDFQDPTAVVILDAGGQDVSMPSDAGSAVSGGDLEKLAMDYDPDTDTLSVGLGSYGIAGDVDGDNDPGNTTGWLQSLGGDDESDFGGDESFAVCFDLDQDGVYDVIAGVNAGGDLSSFTVAAFDSSASSPGDAFGSDLSGHVGGLFGSPNAAAPHLEFTVENFSTLADTAGITDTSGAFTVSAFVGAGNVGGIGDDFLPDPNGGGEICFDDDGDGYTTCDDDCDDTDADVSPGAEEVCDSLDNDCDGDIDEDGVCGGDVTCEPPDDCLSVWEAHNLGILDIMSDDDLGAGVTFTNLSDDLNVCLDELTVYNSDDAQQLFIDPEVTDAGIELEPGESHTVYYGSWTTPNGTRELYLGEDAWWCADSTTPYEPDSVYTYTGEGVPEGLLERVALGRDTDSDGIDDRDDWFGSNAVVAQADLWSYQKNFSVLTVGKLGVAEDCGITVTLAARNTGDVLGDGTITDTIPAGWDIDNVDVSPDSRTTNTDGSQTITWDVSLDPRNETGAISTISYTLIPDVALDQNYVYLPEASLDYNDGSDDISVDSMPVGLFDVELDCDDSLTCATEEVCDGLDNDHDGDVDEDLSDVDGDGTCDDLDTEECDGVDNDGDGDIDEGLADSDGDGICDAIDTEECDGLDNDGDGDIDEDQPDGDGDGICDDLDTEECDGVDNDGDGDIDEGLADTDGDGTCDAIDTEECDGLDNDGDGDVDEGFDSDSDGTPDCSDTEECDGVDNDGDGDIDEGQSDVDGDGTCDDLDTEECDGVDNDGDGDIDEGLADSDSDGICDAIDTEECDGLDNDGDGDVDEGLTDTDGDGTCDAIDTEECDGLDNDGDGDIDEGFDSDSDGTPDCSDIEECDGVDNDGDGDIDEGQSDVDGDGTCDDLDTEECDGVDNDGDGDVDEGLTDTDGDGTCDALDVEECDGVDNDGDGDIDEGFDEDGDGYTSCGDDCDDTDSTVNPDAEEVCDDSVDNDCDGDTDEDCEVCVAYDLGTAADYNVFVFGDYSDGLDVRGMVAAGGTVTMDNFAVGPDASGGDVLVADELVLSNGTVYGNAVYDSSASVSSTVTYASGGSLVNDTPIDFSTEEAALTDLSASLCSEAVTGTVTSDGYGGIEIEGTASDVNVVELDISELEAATSVALSAPSGSALVVNVTSDSSSTIGSFGFSLTDVDETGVLWNFCDATVLDFSAIGIEGTVLAPLADVTFDNGNFDGNIIAASLLGDAEGHSYPYDPTFEICEE